MAQDLMTRVLRDRTAQVIAGSMAVLAMATGAYALSQDEAAERTVATPPDVVTATSSVAPASPATTTAPTTATSREVVPGSPAAAPSGAGTGATTAAPAPGTTQPVMTTSTTSAPAAGKPATGGAIAIPGEMDGLTLKPEQGGVGRQGTFAVPGTVSLSGAISAQQSLSKAACTVSGATRTIQAVLDDGTMVTLTVNGAVSGSATVAKQATQAATSWQGGNPGVTIGDTQVHVTGLALRGTGDVSLTAEFHC